MVDVGAVASDVVVVVSAGLAVGVVIVVVVAGLAVVGFIQKY